MIKRCPKHSLAMTLLEVMVAISIFGLVSVSVFSVFRVAMRSMKKYDEEGVALQQARVTLDLLSRDLRAVFYQNPAIVNKNFLYKEQQLRRAMELDEQRALQNGTERRFIDDPQDPDFKDYWGELNEKGVEIDMDFTGSQGEETDTLEFIRYYSGGLEPTRVAWNMGRVKYSVEDGILFRGEDFIERPEFDAYGERMEARDAPRERIADNVEIFDLIYGFWYEHEWEETGTWNSADTNYRDPFKKYDPLRGMPELETFFRYRPEDIPDGLPTYVDITLGIRNGYKDEEREGKLLMFQTRIMLPISLENYRPLGSKEKTILYDLGLLLEDE